MKKKPQESVIQSADAIVNSERQAEYGDPVENAVAEAIIAATMGLIVSPSDIARTMIAVKTRRTALNDKRDTRIDLIGYTEILDRVIQAEANGETKKIAATMLEHLL